MVGKRLGHYRILARLGEGGMGVVYRAEDLNLRRAVALKILPDSLATDPIARERLVREARSASRLNHPNIATIYEADEQDGELFFAMEYVEGEALSRRLRAGPLAVPELLRIGVQVADALQEAHRHGVVHRDIKPGNIMIRPDGAVKVVDFGLAVRTEAATPALGMTDLASTNTRPFESVGVRLTQEGHTAGTIAYMSPEQARDGVVDSRSDIFALGVVLYQAVTGRPPFRGQNPLAIAAAIIHDEPPPPREVAPSVPVGLQEVIQRCLSKDPEQRPQTAAAVSEALHALEEGGTASTVRRVLGRRPVSRAALLGTLAVLAVTALLIMIVSGGRAGPQVSDDEARRLFEQGREYHSRGYTLSNLRFAIQKYEQALALEPGNPWIEAELANVLATVEMEFPADGQRERARSLVEHALAERDDLVAGWIARGRLLLLDGQPEAALEAARRARRLSPSEHGGYVVGGRALIALGRADEGLDELRRGTEVGRGHVFARSALASALLRQGRLDEAAPEYRAVLGYAPDYPVALNNLAAIYLLQGRYLDAIPLLERSVRLQDDDAAVSNLGSAYYHLDRMEEAIAAYKKAVELSPPGYPRYKRNLAEAYEKAGDATAAREWYEKAVGDADRAVAGGRATTAYRLDRAFCLAKLARLDEAVAAIDAELAAQPDDLFVLYTAAQVHAIARNREQALRFTRSAVEAGYPREDVRRDPVFEPFKDDRELLAILTAPALPQ